MFDVQVYLLCERGEGDSVGVVDKFYSFRFVNTVAMEECCRSIVPQKWKRTGAAEDAAGLYPIARPDGVAVTRPSLMRDISTKLVWEVPRSRRGQPFAFFDTYVLDAT